MTSLSKRNRILTEQKRINMGDPGAVSKWRSRNLSEGFCCEL